MKHRHTWTDEMLPADPAWHVGPQVRQVCECGASTMATPEHSRSVIARLAPAALAVLVLGASAACAPPPPARLIPPANLTAQPLCGSDDGITTIAESGLGECDVRPPDRLDVIMGSPLFQLIPVPGNDPAVVTYVPAWIYRCDHMGGEPIFYPWRTGAEYVCEDVDY